MQVHARYIDISAPSPKIQPIQLDEWEPKPDEPGFLRFVRMRTLGEIFDELRARLEKEGLLPDEYFSISRADWVNHTRSELRNIKFIKDFWRVVTFAVTGGSEGHYIHVDVIDQEGKIHNVFLGKTLLEGDEGMDYALRVSNACTKHMGC